jgi:thiosulfate/3-mercaptopyruvate sulfurtransferase
MSSGHIPNSFSLPFGNFLKTVEDAQTGAKYTVFRERSELDDELRDVLGQEFMRQALNGERTVVTTCGSGMTAGVLWLGLKLLEVQKTGLYDEVRWLGKLDRYKSDGRDSLGQATRPGKTVSSRKPHEK